MRERQSSIPSRLLSNQSQNRTSSTYGASEAHLVPLGVESDDGLVGDGLSAPLAPVGVLGDVALLAVGQSAEVHELGADQFTLAVGAEEVVFVPVRAHGLHAFLKGKKSMSEVYR